MEHFSLEKLRKNHYPRTCQTRRDQLHHRGNFTKLYEGIAAKRIYSEAFKIAARTIQNKGIQILSEERFNGVRPYRVPFERFIGELYKHMGYRVKWERCQWKMCYT